MREIKFRGLTVDGREWVYGNLLLWPNRDTFICPPDNSGALYKTWVDERSIGQFTGLKDKNGKEIFEGDIVFVDGDWEEFGFMAGETREVYFDNGGFRLKPKDKYSKGHWLEDVGCYVIKGNIYENPELLKD